MTQPFYPPGYRPTPGLPEGATPLTRMGPGNQWLPIQMRGVGQTPFDPFAQAGIYQPTQWDYLRRWIQYMQANGITPLSQTPLGPDLPPTGLPPGWDPTIINDAGLTGFNYRRTRAAGPDYSLAPGQTPYAGGSGVPGTVYGNLRGRGPSPELPPTNIGGKPMYSPARQSGGPPLPQNAQPWERWQAASGGGLASWQANTNPASWDAQDYANPSGGASDPSGASSEFYIPFPADSIYASLNNLPALNEYGEPNTAWLMAREAIDLDRAWRQGSGGGVSAAQQAQWAQQADQWNQEFARTGDQWNQQAQFNQAAAQRQAEQWAREFEQQNQQWQAEQQRAQAADQWAQAFKQGQFDWERQDAAAKNKLTDQGQNLSAFGRRFGPNVSYM